MPPSATEPQGVVHSPGAPESDPDRDERLNDLEDNDSRPGVRSASTPHPQTPERAIRELRAVITQYRVDGYHMDEFDMVECVMAPDVAAAFIRDVVALIDRPHTDDRY